MIEVEKKFTLKAHDKKRLLKGAQFIGETVNHDVYCDTKDFSLAKKDWWLRLRNAEWELKVPIRSVSGGQRAQTTTQYTELSTEKEIEEKLGIPLNSFHPFASFITHREKYAKEGFHIDLDRTDFEFEIAEIELMVATEEQAQEASSRIIEFAKRHKLSQKPAQGKVMEYLRRFKPNAHEVIVLSWNAQDPPV